jgi:hypothetical protein
MEMERNRVNAKVFGLFKMPFVNKFGINFFLFTSNCNLKVMSQEG